MPAIRPDDLPAAPSVAPTVALIVDNGVTVEKATPLQISDAARPLASQAEAEAGADNVKMMSPLRVAQAVTEQITDPLAAVSGAGIVGWQQAGAGAVARTAEGKMRDTIALADFLAAGSELNPSAVYNAFNNAIASAASGEIRRIVLDAKVYAQPSSNITLNNVEIVGSKLARPPYMAGDFTTTIEQTDDSRPVFLLGKNVTLQGINFTNPGLTDAAAQAAITLAGAVTPAQKKAALDGEWGSSSPVLVGQAGDNMSTISLIDICVPKCWYFIRLGNTGAGEVAGAINIVRPRVFSVSRDFIGISAAEAMSVMDGLFSFGVTPDEFVPPVSSPLRDYSVDYGAFIEVASAGANYPSFDGFNVENTVIFGKRFGCLATSGALSVSRWRSVHVDAVSHAISIQPAGRIVHSSFEIDAYSYRFPSADPDADAASRTVIYAAPTIASSTGFSRFSVKLKSDYSAGPAVIIDGDQTVEIDFDNFQSYDFGAKATAGIVCVNVNNANAVIRLPDAHIKAVSGNTLHSGVSVSAGRVEMAAPKFTECKYSAAITGGTLLMDTPTSTATVTSDITQTGGTLDVRNPRWNKPIGFGGYPAFRVAGGAQTFTGAVTVKTWGTEIFDQHGDFASNVFTVPIAGQYAFNMQLFHDNTGTAGDRWTIDIFRNGATALRTSYKMIADYNSVGVGGLIDCAAGDTIDVRVGRVGGAGNFVVFADNNANFFSGSRVS